MGRRPVPNYHRLARDLVPRHEQRARSLPRARREASLSHLAGASFDRLIEAYVVLLRSYLGRPSTWSYNLDNLNVESANCFILRDRNKT